MWMRMKVYPGSMPVKIPDFSPTVLIAMFRSIFLDNTLKECGAFR